MMIRATFVMEQHIGHRSYYENLRRFLSPSTRLDAQWVEITYDKPASWWGRFPVVPVSIKGTMIGRAQVREGLRRHAYDVAVFNTQVPAALGGAQIRRRPYILCTDITPVQYDEMGSHYGHEADGSGLFSRFKEWRNRKLFHEAARILPWSSWAQTSIIEDYGVDPARVEVLPPGVDFDLWQPGSKRTEGAVGVLFVGGDFERKGGEELLRAFRTMPEGLLELVIVTRSDVTPGPGIKVYKDLQPNSPELVKLYQSCDLFVLPTRAEAFGIAIVEAAASGLPVISTPVGGIPDIVLHGKSGFLVKPDNSEQLAHYLHRLARDQNLRRRFGRTARAHALSNFDARANAARVTQILQEVVDPAVTGVADVDRPLWQQAGRRRPKKSRDSA